MLRGIEYKEVNKFYIIKQLCYFWEIYKDFLWLLIELTVQKDER